MSELVSIGFDGVVTHEGIKRGDIIRTMVPELQPWLDWRIEWRSIRWGCGWWRWPLWIRRYQDVEKRYRVTEVTGSTLTYEEIEDAGQEG